MHSILMRQRPDRVPFMPFIFGYCAKNVGYPIHSVYDDAEKSFWAQCLKDKEKAGESEEEDELASICEFLEMEFGKRQDQSLIDALRRSGKTEEQDEMDILRALQTRLGRHNGEH